ncbi:MAG TPA: leucine-rich repeat domain-containing protein, partial [Candidatus Tumulicola sp.]
MLVYAFRPASVRELETLPPDVTLFVREGLADNGVRRLRSCLETRPDSTLRVTGAGARLLERLGEAVPRHVELGADTAPGGTFSLERVESIRFTGSQHVARWMQHFPNARGVRIAMHGGEIDAGAVATERLLALSLAEGTIRGVGALSRSRNLDTLELRDVALDSFEPVGNLASLRSLRLSAIERLSSIE